MKTNLYSALVLIGLALSACTVPRYVPKSGDLDVNVYGSYIIITPIEGSNVKGELLAVDTNCLTVLIDIGKQKKVTFVPLNQVKDYTLRYAQTKNYWWSIPAFTLICLFHGYYAVLTAPVNLVLTAGITLSASNVFKYHKKDITYNDLKMFARFPEGIPANVVITSNPATKPRFMPHAKPGKKQGGEK